MTSYDHGRSGRASAALGVSRKPRKIVDAFWHVGCYPKPRVRGRQLPKTIMHMHSPISFGFEIESVSRKAFSIRNSRANGRAFPPRSITRISQTLR
jgi:hypothetical protein